MEKELTQVTITVKNVIDAKIVAKAKGVVIREDRLEKMVPDIMQQLGLVAKKEPSRHRSSDIIEKIQSDWHQHGFNILTTLESSSNESIPAVHTNVHGSFQKKYKILVRWEKPKTVDQLVMALLKITDKEMIGEEYQKARNELVAKIDKQRDTQTA